MNTDKENDQLKIMKVFTLYIHPGIGETEDIIIKETAKEIGEIIHLMGYLNID